MYWPHGVPRVYAVNGPDIATVFSEEDPEIDTTLPQADQSSSADHAEAKEARGQHGSPDTQPHESQTSCSPEMGKSEWGDEAIRSICVSRSGLMFVTMSKSSIALWQTRVC